MPADCGSPGHAPRLGDTNNDPATQSCPHSLSLTNLANTADRQNMLQSEKLRTCIRRQLGIAGSRTAQLERCCADLQRGVPMTPETYIDGIGWIGLSGGMIRIDFVTFAPAGEADRRDPLPEIRHRLIMTPQTFLQSCAAQQRLIAKLREAGIMRSPPEANDPTISPDGAPMADRAMGPPRSPNFQSD